MIPEYIRGSIAPVFTAFDKDGRLDDAGQRNLLDFLRENGGVNAYFLRCGMGQMYTFEYDDVRHIAQTACSHFNGAGPLLIGTTGIWDRDCANRPAPDVFTQQAVELSRFAEDQGAAGVVHTIPEAIAPEGDQTVADVILRYFETVCAAVKGPVLIYQPPGTADEYCVTVDLIRQLADMPAIKGMKVSTTNAEYILDLTWAVAGKDFAFISGAETAFLAGLCSGSPAVIGQGATVNPQILNAIQDRFEDGDLSGAVEAQRSANLLVQESKNTVDFFKRYASEKGYPVQPYHRSMASNPYSKQKAPGPLTDDEYAAFKRLLESELEKYT